MGYDEEFLQDELVNYGEEYFYLRCVLSPLFTPKISVCLDLGFRREMSENPMNRYSTLVYMSILQIEILFCFVLEIS